MTDDHPAVALSEAVADRLARPDAVPEPLTAQPWWRQSLAHGALGITLLHIERAAAGLAPWQRAHDWLTYAADAPFTAGAGSHMFHGAPALAHVLSCAATARPGSYEKALESLDKVITADARRRACSAQARITAGRLPALAEFDVIRGLSGVGSYLLRRDPDGEVVRAVLEYLVRLTEPLKVNDETLPGWWTSSNPSGRYSDRFAGGHGNCGMAHGIGGPLALLALAAQRGVTVPGHRDAIDRICAWLDQWRTDTGTGPLWPYWVNRSQLRTGHHTSGGPQRPAWCYGAIGLARAQQLAALATGDADRRHLAENALVQALTDPANLNAVTDASLCHGHVGIAHIVTVAATDATPQAAARLCALVPALLDTVQPPGTDPEHTAAALCDGGGGPAFLEGAAGIALAALAPSTHAPPRSGWDTCLLIA
ncbi:lanthionine synthetase C family protein [Streptosporangium sp. NBC_01495]|uniref:lanthionine synthetase C family protein n=1 Tax=Streptosporangium sp. NBC_01495 TaxID=2903899 RepID=UPI002E2FB8AA|nr:lanthionine synthetase C family protein [Streptosporangium sp. NBC_01495]